MNDEIRQIFAQTINPVESIRKPSEKRLLELQKDPAFVISLPQTCMRDTDPIVKRASALYFKNSVIKEWNDPGFGEVKNYIIKNIFDFYMFSDDVTLISYDGILMHIFNSVSADQVNNIVNQAASFLVSDNLKQNFVALNVYTIIFKAEKLRYNLEGVLDNLYKTSGDTLMVKFNNYVTQHNWSFAKMVMKVLSRSYNYYSIPEFLANLNVFSYVANLSLQILNMGYNYEEPDYYKLKKWAAYFLYKACNKSVKKFYKNSELSDYIVDKSRFAMMYQSFTSVLKHRNSKSQKIDYHATEFLILVAGDENYFCFIQPDASFFITEFILPLHEISEEDVLDFDFNPEKYLRAKYNYFTHSLRSNANILFVELVKKIKKTQNGLREIINYFVSIFNEHKERPTELTTKKKYGAVYLLCAIYKSIYNYDKTILEYILSNYILPDLVCDVLYLRSQACFFMSFVTDKIICGDSCLVALENVYAIMQSDHEVLKVDATLAMSFFLANNSASDRFKILIPVIVQSILNFSNTVDIEGLTILLDSIIQTYPEDVANYAPRLVNSLSSLIISHLSEKNEAEDRLMVISGFMRTIENLTLSMDKNNALLDIYSNVYTVLVFILDNEKSDFYQEVIDLINSLVYMIKHIEDSMWVLFTKVLGLPQDELSIYPSEVADLLDNFVTYGGEAVLQTDVLETVLNLIRRLCMSDEDNFFDDDFICGCRIMESLLLNIGPKLSDKLEFFINAVITNYTIFEEDGSSHVYALEIIMHCFVHFPIQTLKILQLSSFFDVFFKDICTKRSKFTRVHDKKLVILFLGKLLSMDAQTFDMDAQQIAGLLTNVVTTLPAAIENRNRLVDNEDEENDDEDEEGDENFFVDALEEDIYFETKLDRFNAYEYVSNMFGQQTPGSFIVKVVNTLSEEQKNSISRVLSGNRVDQKQ